MVGDLLLDCRDGRENISFNGRRVGRTDVFPENKLFLGFRRNLSLDDMMKMSGDELRHLAVTIPYEGVPMNILITGMQGCGKSYIVAILFDSLVRYLNTPCVIIDPACEFRSLASVTTNKKILEISKKMGFSMKNMLVRYETRKDGTQRKVNLFPIYKPLPCSLSPREDNLYQIDITQITIYELFTLMNMHASSDVIAQRRRKVTDAIRRYYKDNGINDDSNSIMQIKCPPLEEIIKYIRQGKYGEGSIVIEELENLRFEGFIGDKYPPAPIVDDLAMGKCPVIQSAILGNVAKRLSGLIQIEIEKIVVERQKKSMGHKSKLQNSVFVCVDEFNAVADKERFTFFKDLYDRCRKFGVGLLGIVPSCVDLPPVVIRQSDYIICFRILPNSREEQAMRQKLYDPSDILILNELYDGGKNVYPKEAAIIDRQGKIVARFFPGFSISQHRGSVSKMPKREDIESLREIRGESALDKESITGVKILGQPAEDFEEEDEEPNFAFDDEENAEEEVEEEDGTENESNDKSSEVKVAEKAVEGASSTKENIPKKERVCKIKGEKSKKDMMYDVLTNEWISNVDLSKKMGWSKNETLVYIKRLEKRKRVKVRDSNDKVTGFKIIEVKRIDTVS